MTYRELRNGNISIEEGRSRVSIVDRDWNVIFMDSNKVSKSDVKSFVSVTFGKRVTFFRK